jgi:hypothetical protein
MDNHMLNILGCTNCVILREFPVLWSCPMPTKSTVQLLWLTCTSMQWNVGDPDTSVALLWGRVHSIGFVDHSSSICAVSRAPSYPIIRSNIS